MPVCRAVMMKWKGLAERLSHGPRHTGSPLDNGRIGICPRGGGRAAIAGRGSFRGREEGYVAQHDAALRELSARPIDPDPMSSVRVALGPCDPTPATPDCPEGHRLCGVHVSKPGPANFDWTR